MDSTVNPRSNTNLTSPPHPSTEETVTPLASADIATPPLSDWMTSLRTPNQPISHLSIPGTHDSCALSVINLVRTQSLSITEQLNAGIRFFDLRANFKVYLRPPVPYYLQMVHGPYDLGIRLIDVLQEMYDWLDVHSREGIVIQLKRDGNLPKGLTQADFVQNFFDLTTKKSTHWCLDTSIPTVQKIQGKIQLVRRFDLAGVPPTNAGIDVNAWKDNSDRFQIPPPPANPIITVQDHYQYVYADGDKIVVINKKSKTVEKLLVEASSTVNDVWYFNYASANRFSVPPNSEDIDPRDFAQGPYVDPFHEKGVNQLLVDFLNKSTTTQRYGVIMLDFPTDQYSPTLVQKIVQNNTFI